MNETNRIIAEWMGLCWHNGMESSTAPIAQWMNYRLGLQDWEKKQEPTRYPYCPLCLEGFPKRPPDYTSSLDAVSKAEAKAVEVFGLVEYGYALKKVLKLEHGVMSGGGNDVKTGLVATATAEQRASAIRKLIEESK